jgi:hypothetical protein
MKILSLFLFFMALNTAMFFYNWGLQGEQFATADADTIKFGDPGSQVSPDSPNPNDANQYPATFINGKTTAFDVIGAWFSPGGGNGTLLIVYLIGFALLIGGLGFTPFINRSDLSVLAGPFIILLGIAGPTVANFYNFISKEVGGFACPLIWNAAHTELVLPFCLISQILAIVIAGTLFIAWIFATIEWWSGRPVGP